MSESRKRIINDRYALMAKPKAGLMSDIYAANDLDQDGRKVAIKLFRHDIVEQAVIDKSYERETLALRELRHPNVVELIDSGVDQETGRNFIVMEWVDRNLSEWIKEFPLSDWDSFYNQIGKYLLQALAFAHSRQFLHRDFKTQNILVNERGVPKLADFGIARLKTWLQPGVTLYDFGSRPFTPPGIKEEAYSFARDVYGFGVVVLDCLTEITLREREDVDEAMTKFSAPSEIYEIIERCISLDSFQRPQTADILLSELTIIQLRRLTPKQRKHCFIRLSQKALEVLRSHLKEVSQSAIEKRILEDINVVCGIRQKKRIIQGDSNLTDSTPHYDIIGAEFSYHASIDNRDRDHLFIFSAGPSSQMELDKQREAAWPSSYEFKFGYPIDQAEAKDVLRELQLEVDRFQAEFSAAELEKQEQRLFQVWGDILRAKRNIEENRQAPIHYSRFSIEGNRVNFEVNNIPEGDIIEQSWKVRLPDKNVLSGVVEDVRDNKVMLYIEFGDPIFLPKSGKLEFNDYAATLALDRQQRALDDIRFDRVVPRPDLRRLIVHPNQARHPESHSEVNFIEHNLDEPKKEAVLAAMRTEDFLVVEGPPGTGKTTFIAEVILQTLLENPEARVLLTSQTHVALDNAVEKVRKHLSDLKIVRIGRIGIKGESRVSPQVQELLVENLMYKWREDALGKGKQFLTAWAVERGISQRDVIIGMKLEDLSLTNSILQDKKRTMAELQDRHEALTNELLKDTSNSQFRKQDSQDVLDLEQEISRVKGEQKAYRRKKDILERELRELEDEDIATDLLTMSAEEQQEWAKYYFTDKPEADEFKKLTNIYVDWKDRFGIGDEFKPALLVSAQVIAGTCLGIAGVKGTQDIEYDLCIVDEASKATPTEVFVPMIRSRRWILVGDPKQLPPFVDAALRDKSILVKNQLTDEQLKKTLFDHLLERLPESCHKKLTTQHRMVAPIGNLINECFYGDLESPQKELDTTLDIVFKKPVVWFSTVNMPNRMENRIGTSWANYCEVTFIQQMLKRIDSIAGWAKRSTPYEVAVLTGYAGQKQQMDRAFASQRWEYISLDCNTVDAYQGKEADIVIYSVTRANDEDEIGFLSSVERINVALSRARYYLGIVGDHHFCRWIEGETPIKTVARYIQNHPADCYIDVIKP